MAPFFIVEPRALSRGPNSNLEPDGGITSEQKQTIKNRSNKPQPQRVWSREIEAKNLKLATGASQGAVTSKTRSIAQRMIAISSYNLCQDKDAHPGEQGVENSSIAMKSVIRAVRKIDPSYLLPQDHFLKGCAYIKRYRNLQLISQKPVSEKNMMRYSRYLKKAYRSFQGAYEKGDAAMRCQCLKYMASIQRELRGLFNLPVEDPQMNSTFLQYR